MRLQNKRLLFPVVAAVVIGVGLIATIISLQQRQNTTTLAADEFSLTNVASGLNGPTAMEFAPDGRLFILEKGGKVRIFKNGSLLSGNALSLSVTSNNERGLLGIAFDPNFSSNQYVYLYYTTSSSPIHNRVSRFTVSGDTITKSSERVLLDLNPLNAPNHNGGAIHFGKDGNLYIAVGDDGSSGNAEIKSNMFGKILRIKPDGNIPSDNPFYTSTSGSNRSIWATGFRNPFTFAVDPASGKIFVNDVGDGGTRARYEEINELQKGGHFGWPDAWGNSGSGGIRPLYSYQDAGTCAITGGTFYSPQNPTFPTKYHGKFFFGDHCANWIKILNPSTKAVETFEESFSKPIDFKVANADGALYVLSHTNGKLGKITAKNPLSDNSGPITSPTNNSTYTAGQAITFNTSGSLTNWTVCFHHHDPGSSQHWHPVDTFTGKSGSVVISDRGEPSPNVWYRFHLTQSPTTCATTNTTYVDIFPKKATVTLATLPSGLKVAYEGADTNTPFNQQTVAGLKRQISAPQTQSFNGKTYTFVRWSDNAAATHDITVPAVNTTYTAIYTDGITIPELPATPTLIKSGVLSALGGKETITDLNPADTYSITVKGTFNFGSYPQTRIADAQWDDALESTNNFKLKANNIIINGTQPDATDRENTFSSDHTYTFSTKPNSNGVIEISIFDSNYADNSGSMDYEISSQGTLPVSTSVSASGNLNLLIHGIGKAGDSGNPGGGNPDPVNKIRTATVRAVNDQGKLVETKQATVQYQSTTGSFTGTVTMSSNLSSHTFRVKLPQTIERQTAFGQQTHLITGDINNDNTLNTLDYSILIGCMNNSSMTSGCSNEDMKKAADLDDNGKVDTFDFNLFVREFDKFDPADVLPEPLP